MVGDVSFPAMIVSESPRESFDAWRHRLRFHFFHWMNLLTILNPSRLPVSLMSIPTVNPAVLLSTVEDGYVVFDPHRDILHRLNPLASLILELCDGKRSIEEIHKIAAPLLPADAADAIDDWIDEAVDAGILSVGEATADSRNDRELSAEKLGEIADRLHEAGKVQTAYICRQKAVELDANDAASLRHLGELSHIVGNRAGARDAYERYLKFEPDDAEVKHLLVSLRDDAAPDRVPDECIKQLYERFSSFYEDNMLEELGYEGPEKLVSAIESIIGNRQGLSVLDLGCGTGLSGMRIKQHASRLVGIDLSADMVDVARTKQVYDSLDVAEVTDWLQNSVERFDIIMACDTCIYFGDLRHVIVPAMEKLKSGGLIAFSVEKSTGAPPFQLTDSGRYVHHVDHIKEIAGELGMQCEIRESYLRMEYGEEVIGLFVTMIPRN